MDLTAWLLRHTPPRPFVVAVPGGTEARLAVERAVRERGWRTAPSPAAANLLVVAGPTGGAVEPYVARVWHQLPAPRVRVDVVEAATVDNQLDTAAGDLCDVDRQREQAMQTEPGMEHHEHSEHQHAEQHSHHGHEGHDMGGMAMPGGVPMAHRAEDRDGLMLDQLHVPLGPVLPDWPAGLIVRTTLQGDVVQQATVEVLGNGETPAHRSLAARRLDSCARLLSVAGWSDAAAMARRLRDQAFDGAHAAARAERWARRVRRSRTLRWLLTGVGTTPDEPTTPPALQGDALARLGRWLDAAGTPQDATGLDDVRETEWTVAALPALLEGTELATARLVVASLDPDLDVLARREARHG